MKVKLVINSLPLIEPFESLVPSRSRVSEPRIIELLTILALTIHKYTITMKLGAIAGMKKLFSLAR